MDISEYVKLISHSICSVVNHKSEKEGKREIMMNTIVLHETIIYTQVIISFVIHCMVHASVLCRV